MLLWWQGALQALRDATTRPDKVVIYEIWDSLAGIGRFGSTATLIGWWADVVSDIDFTESATGGTSDLTVTLPRVYGQMGEPYEDGPFAPTLRHGYRVDVYVIDTEALDQADPDDQRVLIYRGTIEETSADLDAGIVPITVMALARIAQETYLESAVTYTAETATAIAFDLVDTYLPGLDWHPDNPSTIFGPSLTLDFTGAETVMSALQTVQQAAGEDWILYVDAQGLIRFFQQDRTLVGRDGASGSARHMLAVGQQVVSATLHKSSRTQAKRVIVRYEGGYEVSSAGDYNSQDPRAYQWNAEGVTDGPTALSIAGDILTAMDRIQLRGEITVIDSSASDSGYDIESINVGDTLRLLVPRVVGTNSYAGYEDFNSRDVIVMAIHRRLYWVELELDQAQPRRSAQMEQLAREVQELRGGLLG